MYLTLCPANAVHHFLSGTKSEIPISGNAFDKPECILGNGTKKAHYDHTLLQNLCIIASAVIGDVDSSQVHGEMYDNSSSLRKEPPTLVPEAEAERRVDSDWDLQRLLWQEVLIR